MTDVLVYVTEARADVARGLLGAACAATGTTARLEIYGGTGSLYQKLGPRHSPPPPDIVLWFGPFAAGAAAVDGLLQAYQPPRVPDGIVHDPDWKWTTLDYSVVGVRGATAAMSWDELSVVQRLAIPDPERSEVGLSILLASLDRARQVDGDVERGWSWWTQRAHAGLALAEDDAGASALVNSGKASHALTLAAGAQPLNGVAPIPHAISLAAASRNVAAARRLLDWVTSEAAAGLVSLSAWQLPRNTTAAMIDVDWARQQYSETRRRWAQSGLAPDLDS